MIGCAQPDQGAMAQRRDSREADSAVMSEDKVSNRHRSAEQNAELQSWIDNVIVPILVQRIMKPPKRLAGQALVPTKSRASRGISDAQSSEVLTETYGH